MDRYVLPALGKLPVRQVDAATLDAFYAHLRTRGGKDGRPLRASSVHEVHAVLSGALKQAVAWGWIGHNPATQATAPSAQKADVQPPQPEDAGRLLSAAMAESPELGLFLRLACVAACMTCGTSWSPSWSPAGWTGAPSRAAPATPTGTRPWPPLPTFSRLRTGRRPSSWTSC
jgi:hypothetical protein